MRSKFSRELPEAVQRLKGPEERIRQSLESLRRLTNADGESDGAAMQVLNEDALRSARAAVYAANLLSGQVSELIRTYAPEEFSQNQKNNLLLDPVCAVSVTEDSVLLRVPLVPYSVQRNAQRRRAAGGQTAAYSEYFARRRYTEVNALLDRVLPVTMQGRKLLYILHVFHTQSRFRMSPDFDNYDVKDLIDVVMARFGGDNAGNLSVLHHSAFDQRLMPATYLAVSQLDNRRTMAELMGYYHQCFALMDAQNRV